MCNLASDMKSLTVLLTLWVTVYVKKEIQLTQNYISNFGQNQILQKVHNVSFGIFG